MVIVLAGHSVEGWPSCVCKDVPELWEALVVRGRLVARAPRRTLQSRGRITTHDTWANLSGSVGLAGVGSAEAVARLATLVRHGCVCKRRVD